MKVSNISPVLKPRSKKTPWKRLNERGMWKYFLLVLLLIKVPQANEAEKESIDKIKEITMIVSNDILAFLYYHYR